MFTFNNQNQKTQISILKWIGNKVWYIYKMQYNSALNRMITDTFNKTADSQKHDNEQKMPDTTFLGAWIPKSKCWQVWFPLRSLSYAWASLVAQLVKNLPSMQETWVQSPGLGRSPEEGNNYRLQYSSLENSMDCIVHGGSQRVWHDWTTFIFFSLLCLQTTALLLYLPVSFPLCIGAPGISFSSSKDNQADWPQSPP